MQALSALSQIDPNKILSELDIPLNEVDNILSGDLSYMVKSPLPVIDYDTIMSFHGKQFDSQFIKMFLDNAKNKKPKESDLFDDVLTDWFNMLFDKGSNFVWDVEEEGLNNVKSLMFRDGDDYYIATHLCDEDMYLLHYAGQIREELYKSNYSMLSD